VVGAELTAPQGLKKLTQLTAEQAAACASLSAADIRTDRHPPQIVSVGLPFLVAELASRDALRRARPDADAFARTLPCDGSDAVYLYTRDVPTAEACDLQARMFTRDRAAFPRPGHRQRHGGGQPHCSPTCRERGWRS
jgi:trans-2,3-dihydro-3-hydroxyanthranilate isomerase